MSESRFSDTLNRVRKKLLDLTARNPLLHNSARSGKRVSIIDELPDQIATQLVQDLKSLTLLPLPELPQGKTGVPTDILQYAQSLGIDTSHALPIDLGENRPKKHRDTYLQTRLGSSELEKRLGALARDGRNAYQETGTCMLYLVIGYLLWFEEDNPETERRAPLFLIPVTLDKTKLDPHTRTFCYSISYNREDLTENICLTEKLRTDFLFQLPEFDSETLPEAYFERIQESIAVRFPRWKVERECTLSLLNLSNLLTYRALDPKIWPDEFKLENHPLVSAMIEGIDNSHPTESVEDDSADAIPAAQPVFRHNIDAMPHIHAIAPLVDDADSSQHNAIIEAMSGSNVLIQGPPGTGKSQTITNLIAAAIGSGKSVLFVSEKQVALEVVKRRLERVGLGPFCLDLHSHLSNKAVVVESLKAREELSFKIPKPEGLAETENRYSNIVKRLTAHVKNLHSDWKETDLSPFTVFSQSTALELALPPGTLVPILQNFNGTAWNKSRINTATETARTFGDLLTAVTQDAGGGSPSHTHPWRGLSASLNAEQCAHIVTLLQDWNSKLESFLAMSNAMEIPTATLTLDELSCIADSIGTLSLFKPSVDCDWSAIPFIVGTDWLSNAQHLLSLYSDLVTTISQTSRPLDLRDLTALRPQFDLASKQIAELRELKLSESVPVGSSEALEAAFLRLESYSNAISKDLRDFQSATGLLPSEILPKESLWTAQQIQALNNVVSLVESLPAQMHSCRSKHFLPGPSEERKNIESLLDRIKSLETKQEQLKHIFIFPISLNAVELREIQDVMTQTHWVYAVLSHIIPGEYSKAKLKLRSIAARRNTNRALQYLGDLIEIVEEKQRITKYAESVLPSAEFDAIRNESDSLSILLNWHDRVAQLFPSTAINRFIDSPISDFSRWVLSIPNSTLAKFAQFRSLSLNESIQGIISESASLSARFFTDLPNDLSHLIPICKKAVASLKEIEKHSWVDPTWGFHETADWVQYLRAATVYFEQWLTSFADLNHTAFGDRLSIELAHLPESIAVLKATTDMASQIDALPPDAFARSSLSADCSHAQFSRLIDWKEEISVLLESEKKARSRFIDEGEVNVDVWTRNQKTVAAHLHRNQEALNAQAALPRWSALSRVSKQMHSLGISPLVEVLMEQTHANSNITPEHLVLAAIYKAIAREIRHNDPYFSTFDGVAFESVRKQFREVDTKLMQLHSAQIAHTLSFKTIPEGSAKGPVRTYTNHRLVKHLIDRPNARTKLRDLLTNAGEAIQAMKPCFLMGPRSVAKYLEAGRLNFDMLVVDEASQLRPEEALCAIAHCKQMVVVGDSRQLPPTSFFRKNTTEDTTDEEMTGIEDSESLLDMAQEPIFKRCMLEWHYRSRHESLIAFNNAKFYGANLLLFPSPDRSGKTQGVHFEYLAEGIFTGQVNRVEAEAIAARVEAIILQNPRVSLGIGAMNARQAILIEDLIDERAKLNPEFEQALINNRNAEDVLLIKNLENIQGDERDIILISCTYGPPLVGQRVKQQFGPINFRNGWRRLNVLFSRARVRMEVYSSMLPEQITGPSTGAAALREFLIFAKAGILPSAHIQKGPSEEPLLTLAKQVRDLGQSCEIAVGSGKFSIELAIEHSDTAGHYRLGLLTDGVQYAKSGSVRDRDRLQEKVLNRMGWNLKPLWTVDWSSNPNLHVRELIS